MAEKVDDGVIDKLISDEYRAQLRRMYAEQDWGGGGHKRADQVEAFAKKLRARTILDYGCGQGKLRAELSRRRSRLCVYEYDPGIAAKSGAPAPADLVVCTDVLEHVEPERLIPVLEHMRAMAGSGIYILVATRHANKDLPDGRNAHLIVRPIGWWEPMLREYLDMGRWKIQDNAGMEFRVWTCA